jgi:hypothetical protein
MIRSAAACLLAVPALALAVPMANSAYAAPSTRVHATVDSADAHGEKISLTQEGDAVGNLDLKVCSNTSATAIVCAGRGTVLGLGPGRVRIRWHCPVGRACEGHAEGTLKNNGSTLALLHVKATVAKVESEGSTFRIAVEPVGE